MAAVKQDRHHILTLVIQRDDDVPRVRSKVKVLARFIGCDRLQMARLATAASEVSRLLVTHYHDGKVGMSLVHSQDPAESVLLELLFHSTMPCVSGAFPTGKNACPFDRDGVAELRPLPSLRTVFDYIDVEGGSGNVPITVRCQRMIAGLCWDEVLIERIKTIRRELFQDTEESYMENLRAKHEEVLRLLREKTEKNRILDEANNELLQLTNDMEKLAEERTIIEMSLRVADQVRNPATIIGGLSRRILKKDTLPADLNGKMRQIVEQADQIETIVQQFHAMANERCTLFGRVDLVQLVRDCLQSCPTIQRRSLHVALEGEEGPIYVHANRQILKVAIVHSFRHAGNATQQGGTFFVAVKSERNGPVVEIVYHGGASSETLSLEREVSVAEEGEKKISGLVLVRQILAEHQAKLDVAQTASPAEGIQIVMHFPLVWKDQGQADQR